MVMRYEQPAGKRLMFPPGPEIARYLYLGELTGESNFKSAEGGRSALRGAFNLLVGLEESAPSPVELQRPQSGAVDEAGRIYVTDVGRQAVFVFDAVAGALHVHDMAGDNLRFVAPVGIALGSRGEMYVADAELGRVFILDQDGRHLDSWGAGMLKRPTGLARDARTGILYVADAHAHDIKLFGADGRLLDVIGQRGAENGEFNYPTHLAYSGDRLYVTDTINARIQVFGPDETMTWKLGHRGLYVGNLVRPKGVAVDSEGFIYVVESLYDTLLVFNNKGQFMLSLGGTGSEAGHFYLPAGVWTDNRDRVYVADMFNGRVAVFQFLGGGML